MNTNNNNNMIYYILVRVWTASSLKIYFYTNKHRKLDLGLLVASE